MTWAPDHQRVVHHIPTMRHGGAERQLSYVAESLVKQRWDVHVFVCDGGANLNRLAESGATVHRLAGVGNYDPRALVDTVRLLNSLKPSVVHTWLTRSDILGGSAARFCGIPWIISEGSSELAYPGNWQTRVRLKLAQGAAAIISNSAGGDAYWAGRVSPDVERYVIGNALPLEKIDVIPTSRGGNDRIVISAGRLSAEKNVECLVEGIAMAMRSHSFSAEIYGDGPRGRAVADAVRRSGKAEKIALKGAVPTVWAAMKAAEVFISVSTFEGSPNTVLEAMGCGCALVLSDISAHRELAGETALYVDPNSPASIAAGISKALDDPAKETRRGQGRRIAEAHRPDRIAAEFAAVYERAIQKKSPSQSPSLPVARARSNAPVETH